MSNRALTLATLGVLSGAAITLASQGLIELESPTPAVRFEATDAGAFERRVEELRRAALLRDDDDLLIILRAIVESGVMDG